MYRPRNQHTIAQAFELHGRGYWTGQLVRLTFQPTAPHSGIRFIRSDLPGRPCVAATVSNRRDVDFRTVLGQGTAEVAMVEHVLAALYGLEIDNCTICIDGTEVPGWDGSAREVVDALRSAGLVMQAAHRDVLLIDRKIRVTGANGWIEAAPTSNARLTVEYRLDYGDSSPIPQQTHACMLTTDNFVRELASARTFVTAAQVEQLKSQGVAKHVKPDELIVFNEHGLASGGLRWSDECARHKALDLVGDLALAGHDIIGRVTSFRGGHRLNAEMAQTLLNKFCQSQTCRRAA